MEPSSGSNVRDWRPGVHQTWQEPTLASAERQIAAVDLIDALADALGIRWFRRSTCGRK